MAEAALVYIIGGLVVGLLAFFFGIGLPITLLLGWLTWQWIGDQPDRALAIVQAVLTWALVITSNQVFIQGVRAYKRIAWHKRYTQYQAAKAQVEAAGLNWDYEMGRAARRYDERERMYWNVGLGNQRDRIDYFSD